LNTRGFSDGFVPTGTLAGISLSAVLVPVFGEVPLVPADSGFLTAPLLASVSVTVRVGPVTDPDPPEALSSLGTPVLPVFPPGIPSDLCSG
jgi:hypothetical protein